MSTRIGAQAVLAVLAAACSWTLAMAAPVSASCVLGPTAATALRTARIVFVGTVNSLDDGGTTATFRVEEIWKGPNLPNPATVYASTGRGTMTSVTRRWAAGQRYLVFPSVDPAGNLVDNACSPTSVYTVEFDALRPAGARAPQGPPTSGPPGAPPIAAVFLLIVLCGTALALMAFRVKRPHGFGAD